MGEGGSAQGKSDRAEWAMPSQLRTLGTPLLLALCLTTRPLRRRNGLVVKRNAYRVRSRVRFPDLWFHSPRYHESLIFGVILPSAI
jgi:hypothetical protein